MRKNRLLIYAFVIAGIPAFFLALLATAYLREFIEDGIVQALERQQTQVIDQLSEHKVLGRQYIDGVIADPDVIDAFEVMDNEALHKMLKPDSGVNFLVFVNNTGTFIHPADAVVSDEQRSLLELGAALEVVKPAIRINALIERSGEKIGAVETGFFLDRNMLSSLKRESSDLMLVDGNEVIASTLIPSDTSAEIKKMKIVDNHLVAVGDQQYYNLKIDLSDIGLSKSLKIYVLGAQPFILTVLNSFFVLIFCALITVPVTLLTWGFLSELVDDEVQANIKEVLRDPQAIKRLNADIDTSLLDELEKKTD